MKTSVKVIAEWTGVRLLDAFFILVCFLRMLTVAKVIYC